MLVLKKNLSRWSIPYEFPVTINHDPIAEPVVIRHSFSDLRNSVYVIPYGTSFVAALIRAHDQGLPSTLEAPRHLAFDTVPTLSQCLLPFRLYP